jgi:catechol 2,3-dioxygenase-like lactoylglutathione lyase family enzyme
MNTKNITPIVTTTRMPETRAFWLDVLGFQLSYDHEHYLGVRAAEPGSPEIGFMRPDAEAPQVFGGQGLALAISVDDADREFARLRRAGAPIVQPPQDQPWGARSFVTRDPNGVTVYISHPIPAAVEFSNHAR